MARVRLPVPLSYVVEFVVGSRPCSERFFSGYSGFPLSSKTIISKFQFHLDTVDEEPPCGCDTANSHSITSREINTATLGNYSAVIYSLGRLKCFVLFPSSRRLVYDNSGQPALLSPLMRTCTLSSLILVLTLRITFRNNSSTWSADLMNCLSIPVINVIKWNPGITNLGITNPDITNPGIRNPGIRNPDITNPGITNPGLRNPDITNPGITNPVQRTPI